MEQDAEPRSWGYLLSVHTTWPYVSVVCTEHHVSRVLPHSECRSLVPFYSWLKLQSMDGLHLVCPLVCWWTLGCIYFWTSWCLWQDSDHVLCCMTGSEGCWQGALPHSPVLGCYGFSMDQGHQQYWFYTVPLKFTPYFLRSNSNLYFRITQGILIPINKHTQPYPRVPWPNWLGEGFILL